MIKDLFNFTPPQPGILCSIEGGDGTPPAGGGSGDGAPAFDPEAFKNEIKDFTVKAVNGAVSTHLSRALGTKLEESQTAILGQVKEMLSGFAPAPADAGAQGTGNADLDTAIKNATAPLLKQLEEQRQANERHAAAAKAERENRMRQEENAALQSALTTAGVPGPLAQAAVNLLHSSLERDESGNIRFVAKETGPTGPYDERVDVSEGVARFLRTEDGKHFLPARPAGGSGNRGGAAPGATPGRQSDTEFVGEMLGKLFG